MCGNLRRPQKERRLAVPEDVAGMDVVAAASLPHFDEEDVEDLEATVDTVWRKL